MNNIEDWKPILINGCETDYLISNFGVVKRFRNLYYYANNRKYSYREYPSSNKVKSWYSVDIFYNGKRYERFIHRLVSEAFIQNPDNKNQVIHKDGDTSNNSFMNLEWVNTIHAKKDKEIKKKETEKSILKNII